MNKAALHKLSYGLYIITSGKTGGFNGQIANSLFQVTSNPPTIAISINKENYTHELIRESRKFVVSILSEETPMTFIGLFGFKSGRKTDKLQNIQTQIGVTGIPVVLDYSVGYIEAQVEKEIDCGTHTIFFAAVVEAEPIESGEPMTYAYYQKVKGGKSPKTAPTFIQEEKATTPAPVAASRFVCSVCGYVYDPAQGDPDNGVSAGTRFEDIPDAWPCPVCGADKSKFEKES